MIGYFSRGDILDPNGLVNGREIARIASSERLELLKNNTIDFVFVNEGQRNILEKYFDLSNFVYAGEFQFPNSRSGDDTHYLLVKSVGR